jgi:hypothetical protein
MSPGATPRPSPRGRGADRADRRGQSAALGRAEGKTYTAVSAHGGPGTHGSDTAWTGLSGASRDPPATRETKNEKLEIPAPRVGQRVMLAYGFTGKHARVADRHGTRIPHSPNPVLHCCSLYTSRTIIHAISRRRVVLCVCGVVVHGSLSHTRARASHRPISITIMRPTLCSSRACHSHVSRSRPPPAHHISPSSPQQSSPSKQYPPGLSTTRGGAGACAGASVRGRIRAHPCAGASVRGRIRARAHPSAPDCLRRSNPSLVGRPPTARRPPPTWTPPSWSRRWRRWWGARRARLRALSRSPRPAALSRLLA